MSVIIVTYNSASCIEECLESVVRQEGGRAEIIVVDNHSHDDTRERVRRFGPAVRLVANEENRGFGRACNDGFVVSRGRLIFFLNPDAKLAERDALACLCRSMEENLDWGLAGTRVLSSNGKAEAPPATRYPSERHCSRDFSKLPGKIAWVLGASMIVRREVFAALNGFDPQFFLYSEETDLCLRVREYGRQIGFIPQVTVYHIGGASERGKDPYQVRLRSMTGLHQFWMKHYPRKDVMRMVRLDWIRASFRREWYGIIARFCGPGSAAFNKRSEYAAVSEASRVFLETHGAKLPVFPC